MGICHAYIRTLPAFQWALDKWMDEKSMMSRWRSDAALELPSRLQRRGISIENKNKCVFRYASLDRSGSGPIQAEKERGKPVS